MTTQLSPEPAIRVQGLEKSYKKLEVLRGVDFDMASGSIVARLGSGSGAEVMAPSAWDAIAKDCPASIPTTAQEVRSPTAPPSGSDSGTA